VPTYAEKLEELQRLKAEVRRLERLAETEAKSMRPLTEADEHQMRADQVEYDPAYQAANRRAPPAMPFERPGEYRRRLAVGIQTLSTRWAKADLNAQDDKVFEITSQQIRADAIANGRTHGLQPLEIRRRVREDASGHRVVEYDGGPRASYIRQFTRPPQLAIFKSEEEYRAMSRDANLSRINEIVRTLRPPLQAPRAAF
jgi:hypothetical protein